MTQTREKYSICTGKLNKQEETNNLVLTEISIARQSQYFSCNFVPKPRLLRGKGLFTFIATPKNAEIWAKNETRSLQNRQL